MYKTEMRFTEAKIENINHTFDEIRHQKAVNHISGIHGLNIADSIQGATVFSNNWKICTVDEINSLIDELTDMKKAIEDETGLVLRG